MEVKHFFINLSLFYLLISMLINIVLYVSTVVKSINNMFKCDFSESLFNKFDIFLQ